MLLPIACLLMSAKLISPFPKSTSTELDRSLFCVNDYLYTIDCSLTIAPTDKQPDNGSYWLKFEENVWMDYKFQRKTHMCKLSYTNGYNVCSFDRHQTNPRPQTFSADDTVDIYLCRKVDLCELLEKYSPHKNITPIAPSSLTVVLNSSQFLFSWNSSYETYLPNFYLCNSLTYHLQVDREGHKENILGILETRLFTAEVEEFAPDAEYTARVRSAPEKSSEYKGHWSQWSAEFRWKTPAKAIRSVGLDNRLTITVCVLVPVLLLLHCIPILMLRKRTFIPTPVLHFSPLYINYQGYIKSWVVTPSINTDLIKTENTAQIDVITECVDVPVEEGKARLHQEPGTRQAAPCSGVPKLARTVSCLVVPYAVTPAPDTKGPVKSLSHPDNSGEVDPDCWLCSVTSLEREGGHRWYRNAYCTLSDRHCALDHECSAAGAGHTDARSFFRKEADVD